VTLSAGHAVGAAVVLTEPLSFWGGVDDDGTIVDVHHPQCGTSLAGRVVFLPRGRGSSSSSSSLAELIRTGRGPLGIVLGRPDSIIAVASIVAAELYRVHVPVVVVPTRKTTHVASGDTVEIRADRDVAIIGSEKGVDHPGDRNAQR
jgi:predicted aconitase with swiveling domain